MGAVLRPRGMYKSTVQCQNRKIMHIDDQCISAAFVWRKYDPINKTSLVQVSMKKMEAVLRRLTHSVST